MPDATAPLPNPNTYWVIPNKFLAGEYPGDKDPVKAREKINRFLKFGVRHFIDLTESGESGLLPYEAILLEESRAAGISATYQRFPMRDLSVPGDADHLGGVLLTIDRRIREGEAVFVHCWGGVGRTGLVVGCWLQEHGLTSDDALAELSRKWGTVAKSSRKPQSPETTEQVNWVRTWPQRRRDVEKLLLRDRYRGALLGLAVGDALGTTLEFKAPGTFKPITDMIGGGPFGLQPGQWTDDTSMALCLAESLIEKRCFDPKDQMDRYSRWWKEGYVSSTGTCFDIGLTVRNSLESYLRSGEPFAGSTDPLTAGNGSLMRLAPVPLAFRRNIALAIHNAAESSRTTHGAPAAVDACRYFAGLLLGALEGRPKEDIMSAFFYPGPDRDYWRRHALSPEIAEIANGSFKQKEPPEIVGSGFVVRSLEAALWAFYRSNSFREGALRAVNLGNDADTTGAIYGQLAGAYYGVTAIPQDWIDRVALREHIDEKAGALFDFSKEQNETLNAPMAHRMARATYRVEEDLRRSKAFDDDITEAMLVCALRFDGYRYLEVVHPKLSKETNFSPLVEPLVETLLFHKDLNDNFAAFFALQRYLHKWGGERLTKYSREHLAYDHLFLMLYRQPVFKDFVNGEYDLRWEREFASRAEEIAAYVRNSFRRIGRGPIAI